MNRPAIKKVLASLIVLVLPIVVQAQAIPLNPVGNLPGSNRATIESSIRSIVLGIMLPLAGIIAVLFLIIGGFQFMFAGTNEDLAKKGRATIRNAVIGLVVIILSYVVVTVVVNTFTRSYDP